MTIRIVVPYGAERQQLNFIQHVGRIGYWEFDPAKRSMFLPGPSVDLLASIAGGALHASWSFMDVLCDTERTRFEIALDQAFASRLALDIELDLAGSDGRKPCICVRGARIEAGEGPPRFAGTFQDITDKKHQEAELEKVITQLQALLNALSQGVSVVDKDLRLILWNRRFHEILGFPQDMVFRHARFEDFIRLNAMRGDYGPGEPEAQVQAIVARAREFVPHRFERQVAGGRTVQVEGFPFTSGGEVSGFVTTYTDITDQKRTQEELTHQRDAMRTVIDNFPGGISLCDADLRFTAYNDQFIELLDFPPSLFAKGWVDFEDLARFNVKRGEYGPGDPEEQVQAVVARARKFEAHHLQRARPNGRWLEMRGTPIASGGFVTSYIDITDRKQMEEQVRQLAFYDALTKLPNRRLLNDRLSQALSASKRRAFYGAVMVLDLDNFKSLNDTHGHLIGDLLLIEAATRLTSCLREMDTVARFGGDEFVVMLSELSSDKAESALQAEIIAEKIRSILSEPYLLVSKREGKEDVVVEHRCTTSIGVALFIGNEAGQDNVLEWADAAMYQAKNAGRNSFRFHDAGT